VKRRNGGEGGLAEMLVDKLDRYDSYYNLGRGGKGERWFGASVEVGLDPPENLPDRSRGDQIWTANSCFSFHFFSRFCKPF